MAARKRWRLVYPGSPDSDTFPSEAKAYEFVESLRIAWVAGAPGSTAALTVQVDEGAGWQPVDHIDFAAEGDRV
jgi:hypothetical protein